MGGAVKIPPLVERDAVAVRVGARCRCGVARGGHGVGVVVVAVGEPGAAVRKRLKPRGLEVIAIALEEVSAELVDDKLDRPALDLAL